MQTGGSTASGIQDKGEVRRVPVDTPGYLGRQTKVKGAPQACKLCGGQEEEEELTIPREKQTRIEVKGEKTNKD